MKITKIDSYTNIDSQGRVVALGFFETMHRGHVELLSKAVNISKEKNLIPTVVTVSKAINKGGLPLFDEHHRFNRMEELGIEEVIVLEMNDAIRTSSPDDFISFLNSINCQQVVCGNDYRFGSMGIGNVNMLKNNFATNVVDFVLENEEKVSTSSIKLALANGNIKHANCLLGYNYYITGEVMKGKQLGRTIGVPTANLYPNISPLATGVYLSKTVVAGNLYRSITNIGYNPTVGDNRLSIETYIGNDFKQDIYGECIKVELIEKIRDEKKFASFDELTMQLKQDKKYMEEADYENY